MPSLSEQETYAHFSDDEDFASIYSTRKGVWTMCERAGWTLHLEDGGGREYRGPRESLLIRARSADQMARLRERGLRNSRGSRDGLGSPDPELNRPI